MIEISTQQKRFQARVIFFRKSFRFDGFFLDWRKIFVGSPSIDGKILTYLGMTNEQKVVELVKKVFLQQENCLQHVIDFQFDTQF